MKLWLDDLEELCQILQGGDVADVSIEADNRAADAIDDLVDLPNVRVRNVKLARIDTHKWPELTVEIARGYALIWTTIENDVLRGLAHTAAGVLRRRRRPAVGRSRLVPLGILCLGILANVVSVVLSLRDGSQLVIWSGIGLGGVALVGGLLLSRLSRSMVIARREANSPSFYQRNRDQLGVGTLLTLVSGLIGYVLGRLS